MNQSDRHPAVEFLDPLTKAFADAGHSLYLVGGIVRGIELGVYSTEDDLDLTTDARPPAIKEVIKDVVSSVWTQGEKFGTIGARFKGRPIEITTHRAESYNSDSRKPEVSFGDDLETDLSRRDFTINAMALALPAGELVDPYGGRGDLQGRRLATPLDPSISFGDDPLRILRAARFISRFDLTPAPDVKQAASAMVARLAIVSIERIQVEIELLLGLKEPAAGIEFLAEVGVMSYVFGSLDSDVGREAASTPGLSGLLRRCALLGHAGPDQAQQWLSGYRYSTDDRQTTTAIVRGAHLLAAVQLDAPGVRRFVASVGLDRLDTVFALAKLQPAIYADPAEVTAIFSQLNKSEDLADLRSPLTGAQVMETLDIGQSRAVGAATKFLNEQRLELGPISQDDARGMLRQWWDDNK